VANGQVLGFVVLAQVDNMHQATKKNVDFGDSTTSNEQRAEIRFETPQKIHF